jgi:hypothetical protein
VAQVQGVPPGLDIHGDLVRIDGSETLYRYSV